MIENNKPNDDELVVDSAGQSGDAQGISGPAQADSQSVEELVRRRKRLRSVHR